MMPQVFNRSTFELSFLLRQALTEARRQTLVGSGSMFSDKSGVTHTSLVGEKLS